MSRWAAGKLLLSVNNLHVECTDGSTEYVANSEFFMVIDIINRKEKAKAKYKGPEFNTMYLLHRQSTGKESLWDKADLVGNFTTVN